MKIEEIISSGILETYALGAATPAEKQEVEDMLLKYPEVKKALEEIQIGMEEYATRHAVEVDKDLKEWIIESAIHPERKPKVIPLEATSRWKNFAVAASLILVASIGGNILQGIRLNKANTAVHALADLNQSILDNNQSILERSKTVQARLDTALINLSFIRNPMTRNIALNTTIADKPMKAVVHWNMSSMEVAVDPMTLPETKAGEKYVLWAIVDGKPINEGDFALNAATGMLMMKAIPEADAFAISLEKSGSVTSPEGPVYVSGAAGPSLP